MPKLHTGPPTGIHKDFALRFREACARAALPETLVGLAKVFGTSTTTIHDWRHGEKLPSSQKMAEISKKTKCNYDWLATGRGDLSQMPSPRAMEIARRIDRVDEDVVEYVTVLLDAAEKRGTQIVQHKPFLEKKLYLDKELSRS